MKIFVSMLVLLTLCTFPLLSQESNPLTLKGVVVRQDGTGLGPLMSPFATIKPEHRGKCTRKRMAAFRSWLTRAAMTSLFHKRYFFLFPREYVLKPKHF
jgi:hypothetical protein